MNSIYDNIDFKLHNIHKPLHVNKYDSAHANNLQSSYEWPYHKPRKNEWQSKRNCCRWHVNWVDERWLLIRWIPMCHSIQRGVNVGHLLDVECLPLARMHFHWGKKITACNVNNCYQKAEVIFIANNTGAQCLLLRIARLCTCEIIHICSSQKTVIEMLSKTFKPYHYRRTVYSIIVKGSYVWSSHNPLHVS